MIIGKFTPADDGYVGEIATPSGFISPVRIAPIEGKGVDFVVAVDGLELGAAWKRHGSKTGKAYLSVKLDSPFLLAPANCALITPKHDGGEFSLVWSRKKAVPAAPTTE